MEDLEGLLLLQATLRGTEGRDTSGTLALDTGAGFLALDRDLAVALGITERVKKSDGIEMAERALPRLAVGRLDLDQVYPVLTIDADIVRRVSDRPVLGLLGQKPLDQRAVWIDYALETLALIPVSRDSVAATDEVTREDHAARARRIRHSRIALSGVLTPDARAVPFDLAGDGKILVRVSVSGQRPPREKFPLTLILDTGATKCVLFEDSLAAFAPGAARWPALRGLSAPTLVGTSDARIAMVPRLALQSDGPAIVREHVDVALMRSDLSVALSRVAGTTVHGLLGASFLRHYRVTIDYPHHVLWLEAPGSRRGERPWEYCHVGIQLERRDGGLCVVAVASASPAALAGIRSGDTLITIDGRPVTDLDVTTASRGLEGAPGTRISITLRRDGANRTYHLIRRRLL